MAGSLSNAYETNVLTWLLSASAVTRPTSWSVALYTDAAGLGGDQPSTEANGTNCPGYIRQSITSWTISNNTATNGNQVQFTASGAWATVNYAAVVDQAGTMITWWDIPAKTLANTDTLTFAAGQISVNDD